MEELPVETPEEAPEETEETEETEEPEVTPTPKKRGRPSGSKNRAPDVYTALLDRMSQLEETFKSRPDSSTGGTLETPKKVAKPRQPRQPRQPQVAPAPVPPPASAAELLMESLHQARDERRQRQMDFYASFLPN
jgi:hypothetical protein